MSDWKEYSIEDVAEILSSGGDAAKYPCKKSPEDGFGIPVYANSLENEGLYGYTNVAEINDDAVCIAARGAGTGHVYYHKGPFVPIVRLITLVPKREIADTRFLYYYLSGKKISGDGSAIPQITLPMVKKMEISLPSLSIQKRISSILSTLDYKIECNRRINENLEQQAQALFKSWLEGCQDEVSIGDLSLNITDYSKCNHDQVVLINSSDVTEGFFDHHILSPNKDLKGHFKKRFKKGDILYSQVRPRNRHWGYCTFDADNYLASTQLMVIRNKEELIPSILLYQYIIDDKVWMDFTLKTETRSGTFPQGNYEDLSSIRVPYSSDVDSISKELNSLYSMIYNNEQESRRLAELRDTLLPRLMSGEMKVNEIKT